MAEGLKISVVVPVYRSQDCLSALAKAVTTALESAGLSFELILVNDYSPDGSWQVIEDLVRTSSNVVGIDLRKNFGQDSAIMTGIRISKGEVVAIMDDDLQHDPKDLPKMVELVDAGADICYAKFRKKHHKRWKNLGSWFNGKVAEVVIRKPRDIYLSPYKAVRREVALLAAKYEGPNPYVDGLLLQYTSRVTQIVVDHHARHAGLSTFTLTKSIRVWARLAFSFSILPLRVVTFVGLFLSLLSGVLTVLLVIQHMLWPEDFSNAIGWASQVVAQLLIGGFLMCFLGIIGEYTGRMFMAINKAPQTSVRVVTRHK